MGAIMQVSRGASIPGVWTTWGCTPVAGGRAGGGTVGLLLHERSP